MSIIRNIALLLLCFPLTAGETIFTMKDATGDDNGAGTIAYPSGADFERGDLDLISFSAEKSKKGTWFEVRFANNVRKPDERTSSQSNLPMKDIVDHDFYTINVDVYIDTDGKVGSGLTSTLPGRDVVVSKATAWEKAVALTPRPNNAESLLRGMMTKKHRKDLEDSEGSLSQERVRQMREDMRELVEQRFFFPTRVNVRGRSIRFLVPKEFLGGHASADWRYLVVVTGCDPEQRTNVPILSGRGEPGLMMMPFNYGRPFESFRTEFDSDPGQPRIIDALYPTADQQVKLLSNFDSIKGVAAILPGIAPDQKEIAPPPPAKKKPVVVVKSRDKGKTTGKKAPVKVEPKTKPDADRLLKPTPAKKKKPQVPKRSVAERLKELEDLRKQGLITEEEYKALRKKILEDL
ncbi:MAG: glucodextranase DOMON-like domain-containing protein [Acidobacteriota bacterium]|nr:glucodextranase DOMON-like domain-containing protein [Acidobacteriota bacterium]